MYTLQIIDEGMFSCLNCVCLFTEEGGHSFARVEYDGIPLKFSYMSDSIKPQFIETNDSIVVGIDLDICIYSKIAQSVVLNIRTDWYFIEFFIEKDKLVAFTELDVYIIDLVTYEVLYTHSYFDVYTDYEFNDNKLKIHYMEGDEIIVDLEKYFNN